MKERKFICWALRDGDHLFYQWGGYPQLYATEQEAERDIRNPNLSTVQVEVTVREARGAEVLRMTTGYEVTQMIERQFNLDDRRWAVETLVHALDHIRKTEKNLLAMLNAAELISDGIKNALDGRSTGREWRTIRHTYRNERDGPHPPCEAEQDRRCQRCGAINPKPLEHCYQHDWSAQERRIFA